MSSDNLASSLFRRTSVSRTVIRWFVSIFSLFYSVDQGFSRVITVRGISLLLQLNSEFNISAGGFRERTSYRAFKCRLSWSESCGGRSQWTGKGKANRCLGQIDILTPGEAHLTTRRRVNKPYSKYRSKEHNFQTFKRLCMIRQYLITTNNISKLINRDIKFIIDTESKRNLC